MRSLIATLSFWAHLVKNSGVAGRELRSEKSSGVIGVAERFQLGINTVTQLLFKGVIGRKKWFHVVSDGGVGGVAALVLLLRFCELAVTPGQLLHQFGKADIGMPDMLRAAKQLKLKARAVTCCRRCCNAQSPFVLQIY
jgi:hypothetical protein